MTDDVLVSHLVETPAAVTPVMPNKEAIEGRAVIAYQSILDDYDVTIAGSSAATGFPAVNVKSRLTHSGWKPSAGGTQYLTFTASAGGKYVDYLGLAAHNLATKGASLDLETSEDGVAWTSLIGGYIPVSDGPILLTFAAQEKLYYRVAVGVDGASYPTIGVVMLGRRLALQRGIYVGHRPAPFQRQVVKDVSKSEGGNVLGSSVVRRGNANDVALRRITPTWYRAYLDDFFEAALERPYFFLWNTAARYQGEVFFGEMTGPPQPVNEHQSFMGMDWSQEGLA